MVPGTREGRGWCLKHTTNLPGPQFMSCRKSEAPFQVREAGVYIGVLDSGTASLWRRRVTAGGTRMTTVCF